MNKQTYALLFISILFLIISSCQAPKEEQKTYYPNGGIELITTIMGNNHFCFENFNKNGKLSKSFCAINDQKTGAYKEFYETGELFFKGTYKADKRDGTCFYYHKNGKVKDEGNYLKGIKSGFQHSYFENGDLRVTNYFVDGKNHYIKQMPVKGKTTEVLERFIPKVEILSDIVLEVGDTLRYSIALPLPEKLTANKAIYFYYDVVLDDGKDAYLSAYPSLKIPIPDKEIIKHGSIMLNPSEVVFYGLIGTKEGKEIVFHDPPFVQKVKVVE